MFSANAYKTGHYQWGSGLICPRLIQREDTIDTEYELAGPHGERYMYVYPIFAIEYLSCKYLRKILVTHNGGLFQYFPMKYKTPELTQYRLERRFGSIGNCCGVLPYKTLTDSKVWEIVKYSLYYRVLREYYDKKITGVDPDELRDIFVTLQQENPDYVPPEN